MVVQAHAHSLPEPCQTPRSSCTPCARPFTRPAIKHASAFRLCAPLAHVDPDVWPLQTKLQCVHYRAMVRRGLRVGAAQASVLVCLASAVAIGCGGDDGATEDNTPLPQTRGQVTAPWTSYCVGTFTRDYVVVDGFGDPQFTAKSGESYLLAEHYAHVSFELIYLVDGAPYSIAVEGEASRPFESSCVAAAPYYAVFKDTAIFKDEALTEKACDLAAGTVLPADLAKPRGYSAVDFSFGETSTFNVFLNAFAANCGGLDAGYISVPSVEVLGTTTYLVPIETILGPASP